LPGDSNRRSDPPRFPGPPRTAAPEPRAGPRAGRGRGPFRVRLHGCTSFFNPRTWPGREELIAIEIGWTWLAASAQRTGINAEAKLLLLTYAFETLKVARADLKTDARNQRSRQAIEHLGARFEGVLRNWSPSRAPGEEGSLRDNAIFSVTVAEWPTVKSSLAKRVARPVLSRP
jgi:N-acetyltransferase